MLRQQPNGCVTWSMNAFVYMERKKGFFSCYWTMWQKNVVLKDKTGKFYGKCHRHRAIRAMEPLRKPSPQCVRVAGAYLAVLKRQNPVFWSDNTLSDASVDDQTRSVDPHSIQCEMRHTNDPVREDSWTENYRKSSPSRSDTLSNEHLIGAAAGVMRSRAVRPFQEPARCVPAALNAMLFTPWSPHSNLACRLRLQRPAYEELIEARKLPKIDQQW